MNSEEWARSEGRELNPEGDSAVEETKLEVGGGAIQGEVEPRSAGGNEEGWVLTQLVEELSHC